MKIIIVVFTETKLKDVSGFQKYAYYTTDSSIQVGDHFKSSRDGRWVQVVEVRDSGKAELNHKPLKKMEKEKSMISGIKEKYMSQYIPERVPNAKMSADGSICVLIGSEYVGMKGDELTSYPEEFVMDIPVYSISKPQSKVQPGEIIISGKGNFGKVKKINPDGSLKILSFTGYTHNKKEVKDFMLGQATVRVLVNMFDVKDGFNPLIFSMISGDGLDMKTLALMQMMPGANKRKGLFENPMMMAMMMTKDNGKDSDFPETMMMMEMMGGQNPFSGMMREGNQDSTPDVIKDLLETDKEFKTAFVRAMKKRNEGGTN